jgi:hypothetical protein
LPRLFFKNFYKIYIPITIYEILEDPKFCNPDKEGGYQIVAKDISNEAHNKFGSNFQEYYETFQNIISEIPYKDPLDDTIDSLKNTESFFDSDKEMSEEELRDAKAALYERTAHFLHWDFSSSATNNLGAPSQPSQSKLTSQKNRLMLGESNFSFSVAFCKNA